MKWITHQTGAVICGLALSLPLAGLIGAGVGSILPDLVDQQRAAKAPRQKRQKTFNRLHRGASHWFGWWLILFLLLMALPLPSLVLDAGAGLFLGALAHIGMDLLTPRGVPVLPLGRSPRVALPICSTGSLREYLFLAFMAGAAIFWFWEPLAEVVAAAI